MRKAYRILAGLIAVEVVIQAASMVYAVAGLGKYIDDGATVDKAAFESDDLSFTGLGGFIVHGINGTMIIPLIGIVLLVISFFAKVPGGVKWAAILVGLIALQVFLGIFGHEVPFVGALHGINALVLFSAAGFAARRTATGTATADTEVPQPVA